MSGDRYFKDCDCGEPKWERCPHSWGFKFQYAGTRWRITLDAHLTFHPDPRWPDGHVAAKTDVRTLADEIRVEIRAGRYERRPANAVAALSPGTGRTFDELREIFRDRVLKVGRKGKPAPLTWANNYGMTNKLAAVRVRGRGTFGSLPLASIDEDAIETAFDEVTEDAANGTKGKYRGVLVRFFTWAVKKGYLAVSPITDETDLDCGGKDHMRRVRVPPALESDLIEAANEGRKDGSTRLAGMIRVALDCGLRHGELLALRHGDRKRNRDGLRFLDVAAVERGGSKTNVPRVVPETPNVTAVLDYLSIAPFGEPYRPGDYLFGDLDGSRVRSVKKSWRTAVLRAHRIEPVWTSTGGLDERTRAAFAALNDGEGLWWTDLRHECAIRWHERGVPLATIAQLLGHSDLKMLEVYLGITGQDALATYDRIYADVPSMPFDIRGRDGRMVRLEPAKSVRKVSETPTGDVGPATIKRDKVN